MSKLDDVISQAEDIAHEKRLIKDLVLELIDDITPLKPIPGTTIRRIDSSVLRQKIEEL